MEGIQPESQGYRPFIKLKNKDGTETVHYSLFYEGIPDEFKTVALKQLNETEERKKNGLLKLKHFLERENVNNIDDYLLIAVLRASKYNLKKSETKLKQILKLRNMIIDKLEDIDMKVMENVLDHMTLGALPYRDKYGRAVIFTTPNVDFDLFDVGDATMCAMCFTILLLAIPLTAIAGITYIAECKCPSLSLLCQIMNAFRKHITSMLNVPIRCPIISVINENFIIRWTYSLLCPLLPSKLTERVSFYGKNLEKLQEIYPPGLLPEEFGGTMGPMTPKPYKEEVLNFIKKLKNEKQANSNRKK